MQHMSIFQWNSKTETKIQYNYSVLLNDRMSKTLYLYVWNIVRLCLLSEVDLRSHEKNAIGKAQTTTIFREFRRTQCQNEIKFN